MNFTEKTRSKKSYFEKIQIKSKTFQNSTRISINSIEEYLKKQDTSDENNSPTGTELLEQAISEIRVLDDEDRKIDAICDIAQVWINHLNSLKKAPKTIRDYFSFFKLYLHYRGIRLTAEDVKQSIDFPAKITEEKYPLTPETIRDILNVSSYSKKGLYLSLLSSGMRIGEAVQIRKKDIFLDFDRILIRVPAKITKTKQGRTTYISREAAKFVIPKMKKINDDDLIFGTNINQYSSLNAEEKAFRDYLKKIGFSEKYDTGRLKISLHSFRAFFFTKAARVHDENYAHKMTGHGGYLMQYDRLTDEEKLEMYVTLEPELLIYDQSKNEEKIRKLKQDNLKFAEQEEEIKKQNARILQLERAFLESKGLLQK